MTRRVYISLSGSPVFKVSQAGYDAATTSSDHLTFDPFNAGLYQGVYTSGVLYNSDGWSSFQIGNAYFGQIQITRLYYQLNFAKTFATPPQVMYMIRPAGNSSWGATPRYAHVQQFTNGRSGTAVTVLTTTTYAYFAVDYQTYYKTGTSAWDFAYMVLQS